MSPQYLTPGVYVEEVDKGSKPIEGVATSIAAFVGFTGSGPVNYPTFIANWSQFVDQFGGFILERDLAHAGVRSYLANAVYGYFNNGGGMCYISSIGNLASKLQVALNDGSGKPLLVVSAIDPARENIAVEVSKAGPSSFNLTIRWNRIEEVFEGLSLDSDSDQFALSVVNAESALVRIAEAEAGAAQVAPESEAPEEKEETSKPAPRPRAPQVRLPGDGVYPLVVDYSEVDANLPQITAALLKGSAAARSGIAGLELADDATMVMCPDVMGLFEAGKLSQAEAIDVQKSMLNHSSRAKGRVAILDSPPGLSPQQVKDWKEKTANLDSAYGVLYYPWIRVGNPLGRGIITVPPSGHIAGVYARVDGQRGVHKAPANEIVQGAVGPDMQVTKNEQAILNPVGINCIRAFPGRGIRVWGARTISSDPSWRYINVRRLFNFVEKSIDGGTQWTVFEPNDQTLWSAIRRDATAFLKRVWMDGALLGATPDQAFYVKCDEELNPAEVRDAGQVIIEIGIAPVKPAEFVVFRISQWAGLTP